MSTSTVSVANLDDSSPLGVTLLLDTKNPPCSGGFFMKAKGNEHPRSVVSLTPSPCIVDCRRISRLSENYITVRIA